MLFSKLSFDPIIWESAKEKWIIPNYNCFYSCDFESRKNKIGLIKPRIVHTLPATKAAKPENPLI